MRTFQESSQHEGVVLKTIGERLRTERERLGLTQKAMWELAGVGKSSQIAYEGGARTPDANYLAAVATVGVDVGFVVTGKHTPAPAPVASESVKAYLAPGSGDGVALQAAALLTSGDVGDLRPLALQLVLDAGLTRREYVVIPQITATAHAGSGSGRQDVVKDRLSAEVAGVIAMERGFLRSELGRDTAGFYTLRVEGDSMERTLADGETIVIDSLVDRVTANGVYVLQIGDDLVVKRIIRKIDGSLIVKSDNPIYSGSDEVFTEESAKRVRVVGRMVWPRVR